MLNASRKKIKMCFPIYIEDEMEINIHCSYTKLVPIENVIPHPDNENQHNEAQIKALAKIIKKDGVRHPIIVSNLSQYICCGHGRLEAFKLLEMRHVPVEYQDFDNPEQ
jgi:ParB-like chromosome segregation protein Spo0J